VSFQGAAIEGTVRTFLLPYWSLGHTLEKDGEFAFSEEAAVNSFKLWLGLMADGVAPGNSAEVKTDDTRTTFQGGEAVFAVLWAYGWSMFQSDESAVKGNVGVARLPSVPGGEPVTCLGGWQWAVSAFSRNKEAAVDLVKYLAGPEVSKLRAIGASNLPARTAVYSDPDVLAAAGWFADALPVVETAMVRPSSPRYYEISDIIRSTTNAVIAGATTPEDAASQMAAVCSGPCESGPRPRDPSMVGPAGVALRYPPRRKSGVTVALAFGRRLLSHRRSATLRWSSP
jgi:multiple sugar transport system substrate-binding protein